MGRDKTGKYTHNNRVGETHDKLTIISDSGKKTEKRETIWIVRCECGNEIKLRYYNFKNNQSCGCNRKLLNKESCHWTGYQDLSGYYWCHIRKGAARRNIPFLITKEYAWEIFIKQRKKCNLSGVSLVMRNNNQRGNASIDRINNKIGYVVGNIQWLDKYVNEAKKDHTQEDFLAMCRKIAEHTSI